MEKTIQKVYNKVIAQGFIPLPQQEIDGEWVNDEADYLRPEFWIALGKACGWEPDGPTRYGSHRKGEWYYHWHDFIDCLAEGGSADSFFTNLLK